MPASEFGLAHDLGIGHPCDGFRCRLSEQHAAQLVELSGDDVDDVDEPRSKRAEFLIAQTDAAVEPTAFGIGQIAGDATNGFGGDSAELSNSFGSEIDASFANLFDAFDQAFDIAEREQTFGEDHVAHGEKKCRVGAGNDGEPFRCVVGSNGSTWIDDNDLAATGFDAVDLRELIGAGEK
ncbi:unannotated protein [freshwater metagenome]|uniref:Unannotated protein n=1 Tax=freshwater metagenome TaxID=449393 RepID=A0A6J7NXY3_9ZZZZ